MVTIKETPVKSAKKMLGHAKHPVFDTLEEAVNHPQYGLGTEKVLELLNAQIRTNEMNALRTARTKGPSKAQIRTRAMNEVLEEFQSGAHQDIIGNELALEALLAKKAEEIEARMEEELNSQYGPADDLDEDEDDEE